MTQIIRRVLAMVSVCGLLASIAIYVASFRETTMDGIFRLAIVLHLAIFVLLLPMIAVEYIPVSRRTFWKEFARGKPRWIVPGVNLLASFFAVHFVLFLVQSHASAPRIKNGEYVLDDHGTTVKILTQSEYEKLKGAELRIFATGWTVFYFVQTVYWRFPRVGQETAVNLRG